MGDIPPCVRPVTIKVVPSNKPIGLEEIEEKKKREQEALKRSSRVPSPITQTDRYNRSRTGTRGSPGGTARERAKVRSNSPIMRKGDYTRWGDAPAATFGAPPSSSQSPWKKGKKKRRKNKIYGAYETEEEKENKIRQIDDAELLTDLMGLQEEMNRTTQFDQ